MIQTIEEQKKKLKDLIEEVKTCMFTTTDAECHVFSRPMFTVKIDNECNLWFFSSEDSEKLKEISGKKQVTLVYAHPGKNTYMNIYGTCKVLHDKQKMKELWLPSLKAWFPEGVDDPTLCLLKISIDEAFNWDNNAGEMACIFQNESQNIYQTVEESEAFHPHESTW